MSPPFIRDATSGFWGFPTSTMDWCEENYADSYYIAEFWNSISSSALVIPPALAVYHFKKYKLHEDRFNMSLFLLAVVGIGSFAFHCTLLYHSQLLDELPMIFGTCSMLYSIMTCNEPENKLHYLYAISLSMLSVIVTLLYVTFKNPLIFLWSYGLISGFSFGYHMWACYKFKGSIKLLALSTASYGFGFVLWNIDNEFCYTVRDIRSSMPYIIQPIFQLHAWWHVLAGIGTFLSIMFSVNIRIRILGYQPNLKFLTRCLPIYIRGAPSSKKLEKNALDINGNSPSVKLKNRSNNGSIGNFARLL